MHHPGAQVTKTRLVIDVRSTEFRIIYLTVDHLTPIRRSTASCDMTHSNATALA